MRLYTEVVEEIQSSVSYEVTTVYVSCSDPAAIQRFRDQLSRIGYTVHDKWALLSEQPETLSQVEELALDQKSHCGIPDSSRSKVLDGNHHLLDVFSDRICKDCGRRRRLLRDLCISWKLAKWVQSWISKPSIYEGKSKYKVDGRVWA
jgi:hypothetical protein